MMKYFAKGHHTLKFLISPHKLENIVNGLYFVVTSRSVPEDYISTCPKEYFNTYNAFYEKLISNYKLIWKNTPLPHTPDDNQLLINLISTGISNDLSKCTYGEKFIYKKDNK